MSFSKFAVEIFQDLDGYFSSKRFVTIACVFLMLMAFVCDLFWDLSVPQFMFESIMYIVIAGVGFTGAEQFAKNKSSISGTSDSNIYGPQFGPNMGDPE